MDTTTSTMELLPVTNALVTFQTMQAHLDSGKCISYYAGGWRTFRKDMEPLLSRLAP